MGVNPRSHLTHQSRTARFRELETVIRYTRRAALSLDSFSARAGWPRECSPTRVPRSECARWPWIAAGKRNSYATGLSTMNLQSLAPENKSSLGPGAQLKSSNCHQLGAPAQPQALLAHTSTPVAVTMTRFNGLLQQQQGRATGSGGCVAVREQPSKGSGGRTARPPPPAAAQLAVGPHRLNPFSATTARLSPILLPALK